MSEPRTNHELEFHLFDFEGFAPATSLVIRYGPNGRQDSGGMSFAWKSHEVI